MKLVKLYNFPACCCVCKFYYLNGEYYMCNQHGEKTDFNGVCDDFRAMGYYLPELDDKNAPETQEFKELRALRKELDIAQWKIKSLLQLINGEKKNGNTNSKPAGTIDFSRVKW